MSSYTSSSLTLRSLLKSAASRLRLGVPTPKVSGLTGPAKALFGAAAAERGLTILVVPTDGDVETVTNDARFFFSALEGLSDAEVERAVLPFPSHEVDPYRGLAPHFDIASARARALYSLTARQARLIIASAAALLPRVSPADRLRSVAITLTPGQEISPVDLGDLLAGAGYTRQDPVDETGEFCVRGGVVDFYPAGAREPIRLEFIGDTIESIRAYDPATQRSTAALDQAAIAPLQELITGADTPDRSATAFDYLWSEGRPTVLVSEPDEVRAHGEKLTRADPGQLRRGAREGQPRPAAVRARHRLGRSRHVARRRDGARDAVARRVEAHRVSAGARILRPRAGLGGRDPPRPRGRRHDCLRRQLGGARRAHDRAARRLRDLRRAD